jgi:ribonuclease HI
VNCGILFNLEVSELFQCHQKFKAKMETLQQSGMRIELEWTPGHAEVQGNEIADRSSFETSNLR